MEAIQLLNGVGINNAEARVQDYPHQLSGGMRQRVMIAMALACSPDFLIADEPTTALDVTIQAQILTLIDRLQEEMGLALLLITHDLGIVAQRAATVHVMYAGSILETAPAARLVESPMHPYTKGLLASLPENSIPGMPLKAIPGHPPDLSRTLEGCPFQERCEEKMDPCAGKMPTVHSLSPNHHVACWKYL